MPVQKFIDKGTPDTNETLQELLRLRKQKKLEIKAIDALISDLAMRLDDEDEDDSLGFPGRSDVPPAIIENDEEELPF